MSTQQIFRTRDLDSDGIAFWGVVSGRWTLRHAHSMLADTHGENLMRSRFSHALRDVLHDLANRRVLDDSTPALPFDADRRCKDCGVVHADHPLVQRTGTCLRQLWGGPPPLNTAGLRRGGRR